MLKDITINTEKLMTLIKDIYDTFDYLEKDNEKENLKWTIEGKSKSQQAFIMMSLLRGIEKNIYDDLIKFQDLSKPRIQGINKPTSNMLYYLYR